MKRVEYMSWENFSQGIIVAEEQRTYKVSESPSVEFFWDGHRKCMGLKLETAPNTTPSPELQRLNFLSPRVIKIGKIDLLEIGTTSKSLQRQFYHFALAVTERFLSGSSALEAVIVELQCFADLFKERAVLSAERQIGLLGELVFLERLMKSRGASMLDAWVGPNSEPHDFRLDNNEFEVKTSIRPIRVHFIHGSEQLVASHGCSLFILSILIGPPGESESFSLASKVGDIEQLLESDTPRKRHFYEALQDVGLQKADLLHYERKFSLRRPLAVIPVGPEFPALTRLTIQNAIGLASQRIESLQYAVNVEGLEREEGTQQFTETVPT